MVGSGISKVPIKEEYIPTPRFSTGGLALSTQGIVESVDAFGSIGEQSSWSTVTILPSWGKQKMRNNDEEIASMS